MRREMAIHHSIYETNKIQTTTPTVTTTTITATFYTYTILITEIYDELHKTKTKKRQASNRALKKIKKKGLKTGMFVKEVPLTQPSLEQVRN
jgi:hypothetical protein